MVKRLLFAVLAAGFCNGALAQDGDAARGRAFVEKMCTGCHAVQPGEAASPLHTAPSFTAVADSPGLTALALGAFFRTSHKNMPNFILATKDIHDVSAYILSLKTAK